MSSLIEIAKLEVSPIVVACSGGVDSVVLLDLLFKQQRSNLEIYHCNYGLRGEESLRDQQLVEELAEKYSLKLNLKIVDEQSRINRKGEGVQEWARRLRQQDFQNFIKKGYHVALGHHHDDLAENIVLRMIRGSSAANLTGMSELSDGLYRPLLKHTRAQILTYAKKHKLKYFNDSSNSKTEYRRNFLRLKILPVFEELQPGFKNRIVSMAEDAKNSLGFLRKHILKDILVADNALSLEGLLRLEESLGLEALSGFLDLHGNWQLSRDFLVCILADIKTEKFLERQLDVHTKLSVKNKRLILSKVSQEFKQVRNIQHQKNISHINSEFILSPQSELFLTTNRGKLLVTKTSSKLEHTMRIKMTPYCSRFLDSKLFKSKRLTHLVRKLSVLQRNRALMLSSAVSSVGNPKVQEYEDMAVLNLCSHSDNINFLLE